MVAMSSEKLKSTIPDFRFLTSTEGFKDWHRNPYGKSLPWIDDS